MATYPTTLRIAPKSSGGSGGGGGGASTSELWRDPMLMSSSRSGTSRGRRLASAKKRVYEVSHLSLTAAERATLEAFYDANRAITFTFTILGNSYTMIFSGDLQWEPMTNNLWNVRVPMVEV